MMQALTTFLTEHEIIKTTVLCLAPPVLCWLGIYCAWRAGQC
jgi:hypothetical protein